MKVCNDYRSKRFGLEPLNEDEEHLKYISNALKAYSYEDVEQAAKHYFATADSEYLNTYNCFNLKKLSNKIQRAKDFQARDNFKGSFTNIPLHKLVSGEHHE